MQFSDTVIRHFRNPQNVGEIEHPEGIGTINNPICGDETELYLRIKHGVIENAKFKSFGCAVTIASASVFTGQIKGKKISRLLSGSDEAIVKQLVSLVEGELGELPAVKLHCPPATVQAFLEAILQYYEKQGETKVISRIKRLIPLLANYYARGRKPEGDSITQPKR